MKLTVSATDPGSARCDLLAVGVTEDGRLAGVASPKATRALEKVLQHSGFEGREGKVRSTDAPPSLKAGRILFVGLGKHPASIEASRRAAGVLVQKAAEHGARTAALLVPDGASAEAAVAACEGALLADYSFSRYKTKTGRGKVAGKKAAAAKAKNGLDVAVLATPEGKRLATKALPRLESVTAATKLARDLGNEPSNILTPVRLAEAAQDVARQRAKDGVRCEILSPDQIRKLGMGAYLAVAQGSDLPPRFIHLSWKPKGRAGSRVALVGKGLTFDSGGISIKPAAGMEEMKMDMCGAAAVIALFLCLPDLGVRHEVHGFVAACDNMPSGKAVKPGDIVTSMAGRTIEVVNTDAEGRLTLVDAITYALRIEPDVVVDLATLTGACAVALGSCAGVMSNDDALREELCLSAFEAGERAWPLPLFADYRSQIRSEYADVKNVGERYGGALTAGLFIQEWIPEGLPWAHVDIAGSAWTTTETATCPKGATGWGVRTLARWLQRMPDPSGSAS